MIISELITYGVPTVIALVAGGGAGAFMACRLRRREAVAELVTAIDTVAEDDAEFINSELDLASVRWQEQNNLPPEAAGLMAARLKTLHDIGKGKGWFQ